MKFFHLSDLHIGKQLHHYNLHEDQKHILSQVVSCAERIRPDAILIAGDVYDKSVPSGEAVSLFDDFLTSISHIRPAISILIIAGNHDSAQRLDYASRLLGSHHIYISGKAPEKEQDHLQKVVLTDQYGDVHFYMLPFLKPGYVRSLFAKGEMPQTYTDAVKAVLRRENIDFSQRNVLLSHQFYTGGGGGPDTCDSETLSVGGIDNVDVSTVQDFDYVALGHLHGAQQAGAEHIRYCGTLLKYSVSEADHRKTLHVVELKEKERGVRIEKIDLEPIRDVRKVRGSLEEILSHAEESQREDYVSVTLTDEIDPYRPKDQLERVYSHILEVRMDNERTRKKLEFAEEKIRIEDPLLAFADFYREMQGREINDEEQKILEAVFETVREETR